MCHIKQSHEENNILYKFSVYDFAFWLLFLQLREKKHDKMNKYSYSNAV